MNARRLNVEAIRAQFPALQQEIHGHPLVYLDNAASAQTPQRVIDAIVGVYARDYSNIHRGVHTLSVRATNAYEAARDVVRDFLGAAHREECLFVRGTTEAINLVAQAWGRANVGEGDRVLITALEHHSNIVPWQQLCEATGAQLDVVRMDERGQLVMEDFDRLITDRTRVVAMSHVSNALGTVNAVSDVVELAHSRGAIVVVDGAQATPHMAVDVQALGVDFYAFSGHKVYGPTGVGILYGRRDLLDAMPPWQGGGDMIDRVTFEKTTWAGLPNKLEAGTPNIAGGIGLAAALEWMTEVGLDAIAAHEAELLDYATERVAEVPGLTVIGTAEHKASVLSFTMDCAHPHDIGTILDFEGVAVRAGHHCAQPVMDHFGVPATARASFAAYNTRAEVDTFIAALHKVREMFG